MNTLTQEIRLQALTLRLLADKAKAESRAAYAAIAKAGEKAKVAKEAARETEEAAQEAELKARKLPGGLHGEPSPLVVEVLSGSHGEDTVDCVARVCGSMLNSEWLLLATSCKPMKTGFHTQLHALHERQKTVLSTCLKVGMTLLKVYRAYKLEWHSRRLTHSDMLAFSYLASDGSMRSLKILDVRNNQIGDTGMIEFSRQISIESIGALNVLYLSKNLIGNAGMIAFSYSISMGSLRSLTVLDLQLNQISDPGMIAFSNAIRNGTMGALKTFSLFQNNIGDQGMIAFSEAIDSGSLRALTFLDLEHNQIGDLGMIEFSRSIAIGSLPSLQDLVVDDGPYGIDHPQLKAACHTRPKQWHGRGILSSIGTTGAS